MKQNLPSVNGLTSTQFKFLNLHSKDKSPLPKSIILNQVSKFGWNNDNVNHLYDELCPTYLEQVKNSPEAMTFRLTDFGITALEQYKDHPRIINICRREIYKNGYIAFPRFLRNELGLPKDEEFETDIKIDLLSTGEFSEQKTKGYGNEEFGKESYISRSENSVTHRSVTQNIQARDINGSNFNQLSESLLSDSPITQSVTTTPKMNESAKSSPWYSKPLFKYFIWPLAVGGILLFIGYLLKTQ